MELSDDFEMICTPSSVQALTQKYEEQITQLKLENSQLKKALAQKEEE